MHLTPSSSPLSLILCGSAAGERGQAFVALMHGERLLTQETFAVRGAAEKFAPMVEHVLREENSLRTPERVIVLRGPGSFTGIRASLALAAGLAKGFGCCLRGVTVGESFRATPGYASAQSVVIARQNRCFVEYPDGTSWSGSPDDVSLDASLPIVGDGCSLLPEPLRSRVQAHDLFLDVPPLIGILEAALKKPDDARILPLYIDPPEATLAKEGLRPHPL